MYHFLNIYNLIYWDVLSFFFFCVRRGVPSFSREALSLDTVLLVNKRCGDEMSEDMRASASSHKALLSVRPVEGNNRHM